MTVEISLTGSLRNNDGDGNGNSTNHYGVLTMMTETARKTSLKNKHLHNCGYFAIIPSCSHFKMLMKNPT